MAKDRSRRKKRGPQPGTAITCSGEKGELQPHALPSFVQHGGGHSVCWGVCVEGEL